MTANIYKKSFLPSIILTPSFLDYFNFPEQETKPIPVNTALIDSFSLKVRLEDCHVIDERLTSLTAIYYESLDSIDCELSPPKPIVFEKYGIKVRFNLAQIPETDPITKKKISVEYVCLTVSSKLLKSRYFEGINANNIFLLYQEFMLFDVVWFSFETFLKSKVSDIDIAVNRRISDKDFQGVCSDLLQQADVRAKHARFFNDETQIGLAFNRREWAKPSLPFIKLYQKHLELQNRSFNFFFTYLRPYSKQLENLVRVEATIKNYAHRKRLESKKILPNFNCLEELLSIPENQLFEFICFSLNSYVMVQARIKSPVLSPTDYIIYELLQNCHSKGYDFEMLVELADGFEGNNDKSTAVARSRIRNKITELFNMLGEADEVARLKKEHNNEIKGFLEFFKVEFKSQKPVPPKAD